MSHYPTDDGFEDEREDPTDYDYPFMGWEGHCPLCGGYTRTIGGNYADELQYDECEECGWQSGYES